MKRRDSRYLYLIIILASAFLFISGRNFSTIFKLSDELSDYEKKLALLIEENGCLKEEILWIKTEDDYIKFLAKKRLGLVEPGEIKFYIVDSSTSSR